MAEDRKVDKVSLFWNIIIVLFCILVISQQTTSSDWTQLGTISALTLLAINNIYKSIKN